MNHAVGLSLSHSLTHSHTVNLMFIIAFICDSILPFPFWSLREFVAFWSTPFTSFFSLLQSKAIDFKALEESPIDKL